MVDGAVTKLQEKVNKNIACYAAFDNISCLIFNKQYFYFPIFILYKKFYLLIFIRMLYVFINDFFSYFSSTL